MIHGIVVVNHYMDIGKSEIKDCRGARADGRFIDTPPAFRHGECQEVMSPKEVKKETALLVAAALQNDTRVEALIPNGDGKVKPEPVPVIGKGCDVKHLTKVKEGFYQKFLCNMGDPFAEKKEYEDTMEEVL